MQLNDIAFRAQLGCTHTHAFSDAACDASGDTQHNINKFQGLCAERVTFAWTDSFKHLGIYDSSSTRPAVTNNAVSDRCYMRPAELALLDLQIGAGLKANSNNLQTMCEAGGFRRITQLMQWAAFTFPPVAHHSSHGPTASQPPRPHSPAHKGGSPKGGFKSLAFRSTHTHSAGGMSLPVLLCFCLSWFASACPGLLDCMLQDFTFKKTLQLWFSCVCSGQTLFAALPGKSH